MKLTETIEHLEELRSITIGIKATTKRLNARKPTKRLKRAIAALDREIEDRKHQARNIL